MQNGVEGTLSGAELAEFLATRDSSGSLQESIPSVTPRQLRLWLVRNGIALALVESVIDELPEPQRSEARIEWEYASIYHFEQPLVQGIGAAIGLDQAEIAAGMREAALI